MIKLEKKTFIIIIFAFILYIITDDVVWCRDMPHDTTRYDGIHVMDLPPGVAGHAAYIGEDFANPGTPLMELLKYSPKHLQHSVFLNGNHAGYFTPQWYYNFDSKLVCSDPVIDRKLAGALPNIRMYMSLSEILYLLPNPHTYGISFNDNLDLARLIQFFEVTRYLDCFYFNKNYDVRYYQEFHATLSPRYIKIYDNQEQLLCMLDRCQNKMINFGRVGVSSWNIFSNFKKAWNNFF